MKSRYVLSITFKSNEHPFSTIYEPTKEITDDDDARNWERRMKSGLGKSYLVTLLRDGQPLVSSS